MTKISNEMFQILEYQMVDRIDSFFSLVEVTSSKLVLIMKLILSSPPQGECLTILLQGGLERVWHLRNSSKGTLKGILRVFKFLTHQVLLLFLTIICWFFYWKACEFEMFIRLHHPEFLNSMFYGEDFLKKISYSKMTKIPMKCRIQMLCRNWKSSKAKR